VSSLARDPLLPAGIAISEFDDRHLEQAVQLWEDAALTTARPVFALAEVIAALGAGSPALVALRESDGRVIGAIASRVEHERAWVLRWAVGE
jgi:hypothetical protein